MRFSRDVMRSIILVAVVTAVLCGAMLGIAALLGWFSSSVLLGALIGSACAFANFLLLAYSLEKAVRSKGNIKSMIGLFYSGRMLLMLAVAIMAIVLLDVNPVAVLIPYAFPRISVLVLQLMGIYSNTPETPEGGKSDDS